MKLLTLALVLVPTLALAQPTGQAPTCEQQLEAAQTQNIQLRKAAAQAEFRAASIEEAALAAQKQHAATAPKPPAAASGGAAEKPAAAVKK